mmetsp:Transcript_96934/g.258937  ORF Transcript_96934/g.258937 Transcript_96934/m.258937 type:complete len:323 (-) Transcript_96934:98-1066(-)
MDGVARWTEELGKITVAVSGKIDLGSDIEVKIDGRYSSNTGYSGKIRLTCRRATNAPPPPSGMMGTPGAPELRSFSKRTTNLARVLTSKVASRDVKWVAEAAHADDAIVITCDEVVLVPEEVTRRVGTAVFHKTKTAIAIDKELPSGWECLKLKSVGQFYYLHTESQTTMWMRPEGEITPDVDGDLPVLCRSRLPMSGKWQGTFVPTGDEDSEEPIPVSLAIAADGTATGSIQRFAGKMNLKGKCDLETMVITWVEVRPEAPTELQTQVVAKLLVSPGEQRLEIQGMFRTFSGILGKVRLHRQVKRAGDWAAVSAGAVAQAV